MYEMVCSYLTWKKSLVWSVLDYISNVQIVWSRVQFGKKTCTSEFLKFFGSKQKISNSHPNVVIENKKIKQVYECKTLGVTVDQHLS
jgi:hypothetical protein